MLHRSGYKQRDKIAKALHSRGDAIKTALDAYAEAAAAMEPPRKALTWKNVVDMATLADFDLLHDVKNSILNENWTDPEIRAAMALHFRLKRAQEEVHRLNVEIRRQTTYMEYEYLLHVQTVCHLREEGKHDLASYIDKEAAYKSVMFSNVTYYLLKVSKLSGFSGTLQPGVQKGIPQMPVTSQTKTPDWLLRLRGDPSMDMEVDESQEEKRLAEMDADDEAESTVLLDYAERLTLG
jgi:hypothetical protein